MKSLPSRILRCARTRKIPTDNLKRVPLALPLSEIHLWQVATDLPLSARQERQLVAELAPEERERHQRFRFECDRRQYLLAHALLRRALSCYTPQSPQSWRFTTNAYGKPRLAGAGPRFNLSHTKGLVVCALAHDVHLGVDVERQHRAMDWQGLAERWLASEEQAWLACQPEQARATAFLRLWTLKEAYVKAFGLGLSMALTGFAIGISAQGQAWVQRQDPKIQAAAAEPLGDSNPARANRRCQLEHWCLHEHWLGLAALLAADAPQAVVIRRDGGPLLEIG